MEEWMVMLLWKKKKKDKEYDRKYSNLDYLVQERQFGTPFIPNLVVHEILSPL